MNRPGATGAFTRRLGQPSDHTVRVDLLNLLHRLRKPVMPSNHYWQLPVVLPELLLGSGLRSPSEVSPGPDGIAIVPTSDRRIVEITNWFAGRAQLPRFVPRRLWEAACTGGLSGQTRLPRRHEGQCRGRHRLSQRRCSRLDSVESGPLAARPGNDSKGFLRFACSTTRQNAACSRTFHNDHPSSRFRYIGRLVSPGLPRDERCHSTAGG